jgi:hypothetical protein
MRLWIRRWLDWAMTDLLPPPRPRPADQPVHLRYEKAGLTLAGPPLPWNADAVVVEVIATLPPAARVRTDFTLRVPGQPPVLAEAVRKEPDPGTRHRVLFRLPTPHGPTSGEVLWKHRLLTTVPLPVQSTAEYVGGLKLVAPTLAVRLGGQAVAAQTVIAAQVRGLTAAALLRSPAGLAALADLPLTVAVRADAGGFEQVVPVPLTAAQLAAREALLTASPARLPRSAGGYTVTWAAGGHALFTHRLQAVGGKRFVQSLRLADARFVLADKGGGVRLARQAPAAGEADRVGPCFALASREPGAAAVLPLAVFALSNSGATPLFDGSVLLTDGPSLFAPGLVNLSDAPGLTGFELRHKGQVLGQLSLSPVPSAAFTSEGGFKPPPDFAWGPAAEDELADRLNKLLGGG